MSKQKSNQIVQFLNDNKAGIFYTGATLVAIYFVYKSVKSVWGDEDSDSGFSDTANNANIYNATISQSEANNLAYSLFTAMRDSGTDEDLIAQAFNRIQNKDDFLLVYKAFGEKYYDNVFGYYLDPTWNNKLFADKYDLVYWLDNELGWGDREVRNKIASVINQAGFVFKP